MFDHPTIAALASWLANQLGHSTASSASMAYGTLEFPSDAALLQQAAGPASAVALAGVSCCYPSSSAADGLAGFWQQMVSGTDVQSVVPLCKWDAGKRQLALALKACMAQC